MTNNINIREDNLNSQSGSLIPKVGRPEKEDSSWITNRLSVYKVSKFRKQFIFSIPNDFSSWFKDQKEEQKGQPKEIFVMRPMDLIEKYIKTIELKGMFAVEHDGFPVHSFDN